MTEGAEDGLGRRRSSRIMEETSGIEEEEEEENTAAVHGRRGRRDGEVQTKVKGKGLESFYLFLGSVSSPFLNVYLFLCRLILRHPAFQS